MKWDTMALRVSMPVMLYITGYRMVLRSMRYYDVLLSTPLAWSLRDIVHRGDTSIDPYPRHEVRF